ncbi:MAG: alpha/beta hydrolase-fold protein, partial [Thermoguttaceae bacterium]
MIIAFVITVITLLTGGYAVASEPKIILVEKSKEVSRREILEAAASESEKNDDGGYNANPSVVDCFAAMKYHYTGGRYDNEPIKFRMLFPTYIDPDKKYPLVIWFHGVGESGDDNTRQLSHVQSTIEFLTGKGKLDFFMIVTQCPADNTNWTASVEGGDGKGDAPLTIANEILETVIQEYPIDTNKISVFGLCSGGNAAWEYTRQHPGRFAAMVAGSATPPSAAKPEDFVQ